MSKQENNIDQPPAQAGDRAKPAANNMNNSGRRNKDKNGGAKRFGLMRLLLWLVLLGAVGYVVLVIREQEKTVALLYNELTELQRQEDSERESMRTLRDGQRELESRLTRGREEREALRRELERQREEYSNALTRLREDLVNLRVGANTGAGDRQWLWGEVDSLVRLAGRQLSVAEDTGAALGLLQSAETLLARVAGSGAASVRAALARDIAALRNLSETDAEARYGTLDELAGQLRERDFTIPAAAVGAEQDLFRFDAASGHWWERLLARVDDYLVVRHRETPVPPTALEARRHLGREQALLALEQARLALLRGEPAIYRAALARARQLIDSGLEQGAEGKDEMLATLRRLGEAPVSVEAPELTAPAALRAVLGSPGPGVVVEALPEDDGDSADQAESREEAGE